MMMSHSSGPLLSYVCMIGALIFWRWRQHMPRVRWGILIGLFVLHLVMKAPVWFLIARISEVEGLLTGAAPG